MGQLIAHPGTHLAYSSAVGTPLSESTESRGENCTTISIEHREASHQSGRKQFRLPPIRESRGGSVRLPWRLIALLEQQPCRTQTHSKKSDRWQRHHLQSAHRRLLYQVIQQRQPRLLCLQAAQHHLSSGKPIFRKPILARKMAYQRYCKPKCTNRISYTFDKWQNINILRI